jgi:hypothetical protein
LYRPLEQHPPLGETLTSGERITRDVVVPAEEQVAGTVLRILLAGVALPPD